MASFLTGSAWRPFFSRSGLRASLVAPVPSAPSMAGPLWVMRTALILPSSPILSCSLCRGMTIDVETFRSISAQIDLVLAEIDRIELLARRSGEPVEALHGAFVHAEHVRARFAEVAALGRYGYGLDGS